MAKKFDFFHQKLNKNPKFWQKGVFYQNFQKIATFYDFSGKISPKKYFFAQKAGKMVGKFVDEKFSKKNFVENFAGKLKFFKKK